MSKKIGPKVLDIRNLTVQFSNGSFVTTAVENVDLQVYKGEIVGLVGESGSGKTTLGRSVLGLNSYAVGEIELIGKILPKDPNKISYSLNKWLARNAQMIFQDPVSSLHPNKRVGTAIAEGLRNQSESALISKGAIRQYAVQLSDQSCQFAIEVLTPKDALSLISEEEAQQLSNLRHSYPWSIAHDDFVEYVKDRFEREAATAQADAAAVIAEDYDQLFENRVIYRSTLSLARKEKYQLHNRRKRGMPAPNYAAVDEKVALAYSNLTRRKADLLAKISKDKKAYDEVLAKYEREYVRARAGKVSDDDNARYLADFTKLRSRYLKEVHESKLKFAAFYKGVQHSKVATSDAKSHKARMDEYIKQHRPPSRRETTEKRVTEMLYNVQLNKEYQSRYPVQLSGGQQQRVGIARAIAVRPKLLVADEPISSLDVSIQAQVVNIIKDLNERDGLSVLFIAHDLRMVRYVSDRIAVMNRGRIVEVGSSAEVYDKAAHPYTKNLLRAVPSIEKIGQSLSSKDAVAFKTGNEDKFYWHYLTPTHKILATDGEVALWGLKPVKKEESNYLVVE